MQNPPWSAGSSANVLQRLGPPVAVRGRRHPWYALLLRVQLTRTDSASLRERLGLLPRQD